MHPEHRSIGELAYHLWQARGCPEGSAEQDWLDAEKQLKSVPRNAEPRNTEPRAAEVHAAEPRAATPTGSAGQRTGSAARPRRSKSTQGKPSPEPPG
jgi:hypothetical protein